MKCDPPIELVMFGLDFVCRIFFQGAQFVPLKKINKTGSNYFNYRLIKGALRWRHLCNFSHFMNPAVEYLTAWGNGRRMEKVFALQGK